MIVGGVKTKQFTILGNVEESNWAIKLKELINKDNVLPENVTLFIFNKNSYDAPVLEASLKVIEHFFFCNLSISKSDSPQISYSKQLRMFFGGLKTK